MVLEIVGLSIINYIWIHYARLHILIVFWRNISITFRRNISDTVFEY